MLRLSEIDRFKSHSNAVRFFLLKSLVGATHISPRITLERVLLHFRHMTGVCVILRGGGCNSSTVTTISFYCFLFVSPFHLTQLISVFFLCISLLYFSAFHSFVCASCRVLIVSRKAQSGTRTVIFCSPFLLFSLDRNLLCSRSLLQTQLTRSTLLCCCTLSVHQQRIHTTLVSYRTSSKRVVDSLTVDKMSNL